MGVEESDLMVVPTTTEGPAVNTLVPFVEAVEEAGEGALQGPDYYGAVVEPAAQLREQLAREGIPTFGGQVRRRQDFDTAALQDRLVYQLPDRRARDGWHDYETVGAEAVEAILDAARRASRNA